MFDYCVDLSREHEWNPKLRRAEQLTSDPVGVGLRFRAEFLKGDPMIVEVVGFDRPGRWETVGHSDRLDARTNGRVEATDGGARLTMRMELRPHGMPRFVLPLLSRYMHRQQERNRGRIKVLVER